MENVFNGYRSLNPDGQYYTRTGILGKILTIMIGSYMTVQIGKIFSEIGEDLMYVLDCWHNILPAILATLVVQKFAARNWKVFMVIKLVIYIVLAALIWFNTLKWHHMLFMVLTPLVDHPMDLFWCKLELKIFPDDDQKMIHKSIKNVLTSYTYIIGGISGYVLNELGILDLRLAAILWVVSKLNRFVMFWRLASKYESDLKSLF